MARATSLFRPVPEIPGHRWVNDRVKAGLAIAAVWGLQVTLALLLLPALVVVMAISAAGALLVWLTRSARDA